MLRIFNGGDQSDCEPLIRALAIRCATETLTHLSSGVERMCAAELRGYVRALAQPWIIAEVQRLALNGELSKARMKEVAAKALEQTVYIITTAHTSIPIVAMPRPHIGRRVAA